MTEIKKVAVIGAGVMGSGIAAHVANAGIPVILLDIVPTGANDRSALAKGAIDKMLKTKPAPFMHPRVAKLVTAGNLEDDLDKLADVDWICEAIIENVELKSGRSGSMIFVTVRHHYATPRGAALVERQDIVYRPAVSVAGSAAPAVTQPRSVADRTVTVFGDPVLLFRYSAVTFNGHRIHYDTPYVTGEEGYPGLVFHGPLQASYLLRLAMAERGGIGVLRTGVPPSIASFAFLIVAIVSGSCLSSTAVSRKWHPPTVHGPPGHPGANRRRG